MPDAPDSLSDMSERPTGKITSTGGRSSLGTMQNADVLAQANTKANGMIDPTAVRRGRAPGGFAMNGVADTTFGSAFAIGDRIYHKERKKEGKIEDISAAGKAQVRYDDGTTGWALQANIVKL